MVAMVQVETNGMHVIDLFGLVFWRWWCYVALGEKCSGEVVVVVVHCSSCIFATGVTEVFFISGVVVLRGTMSRSNWP
jgi:hypothetical protein